MSGYREVLRTQGVVRVIASQLTARFPGGMTSLAVLLHIEHLTGSYGLAGTVLAMVSIGQASAGPATSRWMGAWGMRRVLTLTTVVVSLALLALTVPGLPFPAYAALGLIAGLATPPVQSAARTIYPKLVNAAKLTRLYSLDASLQEIIWIVAPVLTTFVATQLSTPLALYLVVAFYALGGAWFILLPEVGRVRIPRNKYALGRVLRRPAVVLATVMGFIVLAGVSSVETGVVATFGEGGAEAGIVLAVFAAGSLAGGLTFGHRPIAPSSMARRMTIMAVGVALTVFSLNVWWLGASLFVAGMALAPIFTLMFAITSVSVKFSESPEAYGWINTGQLGGAAIGSAVAGFLIDGFGPQAAFWSGLAFTLFGLACALIFLRAFPDLRGRDASPQPDTGMIQTLTGTFRMPDEMR
ncbi:MAG: MFS transporter [Microbacterium sp.]